MASEQHRTGLCNVTNASQYVIGTASCDWANNVTTPAQFKVDLDGESTYSIGTVNSATRITLSANYTGTTNTGLSYMICRSFTTYRGLWRPLQGDYDFAEILSQDTIDNIDEDIGHIMSGNATVDGTISTSFGIDTDGNCARIRSTNLSASRYYHFPDYSASMAAKSASNDWTGNQKFDTVTASDINATTGDIDILHVSTFTASNLDASTGDINTLHSATFTANDVNATTGDIETLHSTTITASNLTASNISLVNEFDFGAHTAGFTEQAITCATVVTIDWALGNKAAMAFTARNVATLLFTNPTNPCNLLFKMKQDGTGSRTVTTWDSDIIWGEGGTAPTLTTTASAVDIMAFYFAGDGRYYGVPSTNFPFS